MPVFIRAKQSAQPLETGTNPNTCCSLRKGSLSCLGQDQGSFRGRLSSSGNRNPSPKRKHRNSPQAVPLGRATAGPSAHSHGQLLGLYQQGAKTTPLGIHYQQVRHYSTWTLPSSSVNIKDKRKKTKNKQKKPTHKNSYQKICTSLGFDKKRSYILSPQCFFRIKKPPYSIFSNAELLLLSSFFFFS